MEGLILFRYIQKASRMALPCAWCGWLVAFRGGAQTTAVHRVTSTCVVAQSPLVADGEMLRHQHRLWYILYHVYIDTSMHLITLYSDNRETWQKANPWKILGRIVYLYEWSCWCDCSQNILLIWMVILVWLWSEYSTYMNGYAGVIVVRIFYLYEWSCWYDCGPNILLIWMVMLVWLQSKYSIYMNGHGGVIVVRIFYLYEWSWWCDFGQNILLIWMVMLVWLWAEYSTYMNGHTGVNLRKNHPVLIMYHHQSNRKTYQIQAIKVNVSYCHYESIHIICEDHEQSEYLA